MANTKVTGDVIANGTISTVHIADDAITAAKLDSTATGITFADLAVSGNSTLTGNLTVNGAFTSQGIDDNADATAITINGNEEVGIGTTSPFVKLHVETTASSIARFSYNSTNYQDLTYEGSNIVGGSHVFKIAGSEKMRLDTSGNVGIGITTPGTLHSVSYGTTKLHIDGGTDRGQIILEGDTLANIVMSDNGGTANSRVFLAQVNDGLMHFKSVNDNGTSKATIMSMTSSGNVGIGVSPSYKLDIAGTSPRIRVAETASNTANTMVEVENSDGRGAMLGIGGSARTDILANRGYINAQSETDGLAIGTEGTDPILFYTQGVGTSNERMRIDSSGNVGIKNTVASTIDGASALGTLVVGDGSSVEGITIYTGTSNYGGLNFADATSGGGAYAGYIKFDHSDNSFGHYIGNVERMRIDSSGRVGIGVTSLNSMLTIQGNEIGGQTVTYLHLNSGNNNSYPFLASLNSNVIASGTYGWTFNNSSSTGNLEIGRRNNSTTSDIALTIARSSGNVGIGNTNPSSYYTNANNLVVGSHTGSNGISILSATNQTGWLVFADSTAGGDNTRGAIAYDHSANSMNMRVNNDTKMSIDSSGNVGISYTGPYNQISGGETTLAIADAENAALYLKSNAAGGHNHILFSGTGGALSFYDKTRGGYNMIIDSSGNVGIGTTTAISTYGLLHVKGSNQGITIARGDGAVYRSMYISNGTSNLYFWNGSNEGYLSSAGAWTNASDERIKKNIVDIKYGLQEVLKSKPRSYQMKEDNLEQIGFIAQEMKEIIPECVSGNEERQLGISYGSLVSVAFKAIQEQQEIINDLKNRIQTLENN